MMMMDVKIIRVNEEFVMRYRLQQNVGVIMNTPYPIQ
jgi:hypothetical protein